MNYKNIPFAVESIIDGAFGIKAAGGGVMGYTVSQAMRFGVARGVFSNEAGLGSSSMAHAAADSKEPVRQAMWGIFEVFADTIVMCTITAFAILTTGVIGSRGADGSLLNGAALTISAFSEEFRKFCGSVYFCRIVFFSFSTLIGWSYYGERCVEYLFGLKYTKYYKFIFIIFVVIGCVSSLILFGKFPIHLTV